MAVGLIGLSACPIGYFDLPGEAYATSAPSHVHEICSRLMFICMLVVAAIVLLCKSESSDADGSSGVCGVWAGMRFWVFYRGAWFVSRVLVFESCYLFGFLSFCLGMQGGKKVEEGKDE